MNKKNNWWIVWKCFFDACKVIKKIDFRGETRNMTWPVDITKALPAIIFLAVLAGWCISILVVFLEGTFKRKRPRWAYGTIVTSLVLSWVGALVLNLITYAKLSSMHKIFNILFMIISSGFLISWIQKSNATTLDMIN